MNTVPLKSFATSARTELIREVGARITAVLSQGSPERVEQPRAVTALERAIAAGGGGDKGKAHVADQVAYTWFNRIIALRFMDANGYTSIGVVSPAADQVGQPEVLAAAKRGQVDIEVVKPTNAATVTGLLNGTRQPRPGVDAQAEAYVLLLADYCRYWNRAMPFMFEREGDYTELLIPANLLAGGSLLSRSVKVLTAEVCQDVEVIGWLYQFYIADRKTEVFAGFKKNKKAGANEIPAATQLFTPHWIVRYLVENSLGRLWMLNHPESRLVDQMDYYIAPVDEEADFLKVASPEDVKVIDPACGSGHMLTYAFDLLYAIYEEEGYTPSQIPGLILTNNLYGTEIDQRAGALAAFALSMKAAAKRKLFLKNPVEPKICVLGPISFSAEELSYLETRDGDRHQEEAFWNQFAKADTLGSLIQPEPGLTARLADHLARLDDGGDILRADALNRAHQVIRQAEFLLPRYSVAVANPPYMGNKNMNATLADFAKSTYPVTKADLFSMFISRTLSLVCAGGAVAMVTMHSWMFLRSFKGLREELLTQHHIATMAHLGTSAFDSIAGEVVATTAFIVVKGARPGGRGVYIRLTEDRGEWAKDRAIRNAASGGGPTFCVSSRELQVVPNSPIAYWLAPALRSTFMSGRRLDQLADVKHGLSTGKNAAVVRLWYEVSFDDIGLVMKTREQALESNRKWFPYNKGGEFRRWYGNVEHVLRYDSAGQKQMASFPGHRHDGRSHYFRQGVTWSKVSAGRPAFRYQPIGQIFDVAGNAFFQHRESDIWGLLAVANSPISTAILGAIAPTINFEAGNISGLPVVSDAFAGVVDQTRQLVQIAKDDWDSQETSWEFQSPVQFPAGPAVRLDESFAAFIDDSLKLTEHSQSIEEAVNQRLIKSYGLWGQIDPAVSPYQVSLLRNQLFRYGTRDDQRAARDAVSDLVSYAVGCMFGRYSLDEPGLILADQGATLRDYVAKVPSPTFAPDADNVIPIVNGDWFEDDIVERFRLFLRVAFGEQHFSENLEFVTKSLGVKKLRDYFVKSFYRDHWQRYQKRPIYWLFSSPKGSFNALIYMHRYTPSTVSTVLTYLREYVTKLESALQQAERGGNAKEADRLRKILVELNEYEHDTLFPKASENVVIDLDDGVKANYPKFGAALKKIPGLEAASD
jgi:hypothetical protein